MHYSRRAEWSSRSQFAPLDKWQLLILNSFETHGPEGVKQCRSINFDSFQLFLSSTVLLSFWKMFMPAKKFHPSLMRFISWKVTVDRETYFFFLNLVITSKILEKKSCSTLSVLMQLSLHRVVLWLSVLNSYESYSNSYQ